MTRSALAFALFAGLAPACLAQEPGQPARREPHPVRPAASEIRVDGVLDEAAWAQAAVVELAYETRPAENTPPPVRTECLLTYDGGHFYAAFRAHDPDPGRIRARLSDRDTAFDDDIVGITLDTFNDERRAIQLFANPLGVQIDLFIDDVAGEEDTSWDAIWDAAGRITATGYEIEIAVPWSSLRFPRGAGGSGEQIWGFEAVRFWPRELHHRLSSNPVSRSISCGLCQISKLSGFAGVTPGRNLELTPTATAARTDQRAAAGGPAGSAPAAGPLVTGDVESDLGLTARWGITPNLALSGAVNPDFSQVEADAAQLDINEQFALFFPEKRPFFLEGADFFATPLNAVFSRNVADPSWGLKLTGKEGHHGLGMFVAEDERTDLLVPGSESSRQTRLDLPTTDAVLRYRRDLGRSSALGLLATSREGGDYFNRVAGLDGLWRLGDADALRFQVLGSDTRYPAALTTVEDFRDQPREAFSDHALSFSWDHESRDWEAFARYEDVGRAFRADLGFLPKVDYTMVVGGFERVFWGGEGDLYTRWSFGADWDQSEDQDGRLLERELELSAEVNGPLQSFLRVSGGRRDRTAGGLPFEETFYDTFFEIQPTGTISASLEVELGDQVDFVNLQPGEVVEIEPRLRYLLGRKTRIDLSHAHRSLDVAGGRLFTAGLTELRLGYQLNLRTRFRTVFQHTDIRREPGLYDRPEEVDRRTRELFTQFLFSYKLNPQTVLFAGYSDDALGDERVDLTRQRRTFFFKVGYAWVR